MVRRFGLLLVLSSLILLLRGSLYAQFPLTGRITGQIEVVRGDFPAHQVMLELRFRGAAMQSGYADGQGQFSFDNLPPGEYHLIIRDVAYDPVDEVALVRPDMEAYTVVHIKLKPREETNKSDPIGARALGGNGWLVDPRDYSRHFPKKAIKEYGRGVDAERKGKHDEAIAHYIDALKIAPDYYPAHNNLGSLYLGKTDFKSAEEQFREAVRLEQNDAQAYFNLGNLYLLTKRYSESEESLSSGLQRRPDSAFGHFLEGSLFARTGRYPEAENNLREALRLDPAMWQAHLQLVNVYIQQNRRADAISELQRFLKDSPSAPPVANARDLLRRLQSQDASVH